MMFIIYVAPQAEEGPLICLTTALGTKEEWMI